MASDKTLLSVYEREGRNTSSNDPKMLNSRVFIGNLASEKVGRQDVETLFATFGKVLGVSLHKSYGFVQFDSEESAKNSVNAMKGHMLHGLNMDVNLAAERQKKKEKAEEAAKSKEEDRKHHGSSRSRHSPHRSSRRSRSPHRSSSSRHRHDDDHYRSSRHRDRRDRSYSPPYISHELEYRAARLREYDRLHGVPPPFRDPFFDPLGPPMDPFMRPRDDPFFMDRFPLPPIPPPGRMRDPFGPPVPDPYSRMGPPPLPPLPVRDREPMYDRPNPNPRPLTPPAIPERKREPMRDNPRDGLRGGPRDTWREQPVQKEKMVDLEIVVVNRQQKVYADMIARRVENLGLVVDIIYLSPTVSLADALDAAANRGLLYAVIVTSQHELHKSVTLTILHGRNPQEHKNMPLEDAIGLVDRDFGRYMQGLRSGQIPPRRPVQKKSEVSGLLSQAASGEQLSSNQLQQVIEALQKQKQVKEPPQVSQPPPQRQQQRLLPVKDDIQRQQADLQAKILSLLGSNAVVPPSGKQPSQGRGYDGGVGGGGKARGGQYGGGRASRFSNVGGNDSGGWAYGVESGGGGRGRNTGGRGFGGADNGVRGYGYGGSGY